MVKFVKFHFLPASNTIIFLVTPIGVFRLLPNLIFMHVYASFVVKMTEK